MILEILEELSPDEEENRLVLDDALEDRLDRALPPESDFKISSRSLAISCAEEFFTGIICNDSSWPGTSIN